MYYKYLYFCKCILWCGICPNAEYLTLPVTYLNKIIINRQGFLGNNPSGSPAVIYHIAAIIGAVTAAAT